MARSVGNQIPEEIRSLFSGEGLAAREGLTFLFLTITADGWPHLAMLSVGELLAVGPRSPPHPASHPAKHATVAARAIRSKRG